MIKIQINEGRINTVIITGHAEYAPRGSDIVCAAISALYQTLALTVGENIVKKDGECKLSFRGKKSELNMFIKGAEAVAGEYHDNVRLSVKKAEV